MSIDSTLNTAPIVTVLIRAESRCPRCGRTIHEEHLLNEEQLSTGNTTQKASYWAMQMKARIAAHAHARGWLDDRCGTCRDNDAVAIIGESKGKDPKEHRTDFEDCG